MSNESLFFWNSLHITTTFLIQLLLPPELPQVNFLFLLFWENWSVGVNVQRWMIWDWVHYIFKKRAQILYLHGWTNNLMINGIIRSWFDCFFQRKKVRKISNLFYLLTSITCRFLVIVFIYTKKQLNLNSAI